MIQLVVRLIQREAALEALVLWDQRAVALPKGGAERRAPAVWAWDRERWAGGRAASGWERVGGRKDLNHLPLVFNFF